MSSDGNAAALISPNDRVIKPQSGFRRQIHHKAFLARREPRSEERLSAGSRPLRIQSEFQAATGRRPWCAKTIGASPVLRKPPSNPNVSTRSSLKIMESIFEAVSCDASGPSILTARLEAPRKPLTITLMNVSALINASS